MRVLVVPAAGRGSRLGISRPKGLVDVNGQPMLLLLAELHRPAVDAIVVVVHPQARDEFATVARGLPLPTVLVDQPEPSGMLDAVLIGCAAAEAFEPERLWVTWCDQVAVHPQTIARLASAEAGSALAFPVVAQQEPYIHFERNADGRIIHVRHRREGDDMPASGQSDMGLFSLARQTASDDLPAYAAGAPRGLVTGERNFLPFIPWLAARQSVVTIDATEAIEAVGINTPAELERVARHLRSR